MCADLSLKAACPLVAVIGASHDLKDVAALIVVLVLELFGYDSFGACCEQPHSPHPKSLAPAAATASAAAATTLQSPGGVAAQG